MPALILCNRKWALGSDDMPIPSCCGVLVNLMCLTAVLIGLATIPDGDVYLECADSEKMANTADSARVMCWYFLVCCALSTVLGAAVFLVSLRGTIVETDKREKVGSLLKFFAVVIAFQGLGGLTGMYLSFLEMPECPDLKKEEDDETTKVIGFVLLRSVSMVCAGSCALFYLLAFATVSNKRVQKSTSVTLGYDYLINTDDGHDIHHASDDEGMSWSVTRYDWEKRCRRMCCCFKILTCNIMSGAVHEATDETYRSVANVMARFFKGLDLVPSDLIAALSLLRAEQRSQETKAVQAIIRASIEETEGHRQEDQQHEEETSWLWSRHNVFARAKTRLRVQHFGMDSHLALDEEAKYLLQESYYYSTFMLGIYGKLLFTYMNLTTGPCILLCPCLSPVSKDEKEDGVRLSRSPSYPENIVEDDCCSLNYAALHASTTKPDRVKPSIVFASFTNKPHQLPYSIAVDQQEKTVIVAVRGTLSAADMLVDAMITPVSLKDAAKKWKFEHMIDDKSVCHGGFLQSALWVREDIERRQILHTLLGRRTAPSSNASMQYGSCGDHQHQYDLPDCTGYHLKVIGHSLGAAAASILSLTLLNFDPQLSCLAYSVPGCVFDFDLCERSSQWIHSIFVGADMVPHASWRSLMKLRGQMLEMLRRSKVNKPKAIRSAITNTHVDDLLYPEDKVPDTFARQQLLQKIEQLEARAHKEDFLSRTPMYAPGKLLHLMRAQETATGCCSGANATFLPVWVNDRKALDEFLVSRNMAMDHFPDVVARVLEKVAQENLTPYELRTFHERNGGLQVV